MILLDTNVISEPLRPSPEIRVIDWIDAQPLETLYLSAITVAELRAGIALMPAGKRRTTALHEHIEKRVLPMFAGRVLPFDMACTNAYAELITKVREAGSGIQTADACIAAVALANGFAVATRDTSPSWPPAWTLLILGSTRRAQVAQTRPPALRVPGHPQDLLRRSPPSSTQRCPSSRMLRMPEAVAAIRSSRSSRPSWIRRRASSSTLGSSWMPERPL